MESVYLIDFENVHDNGLKNIDSLTKSDQVHIFYTENAKKVNFNSLRVKKQDIHLYKVPAGKQSLDRHLISYLGYLLGKNEKKTCSYIIVSKDKGYDNIIAFWQEQGIKNISREEKIPGSNVVGQKKAMMSAATTSTQTTNSKRNAGMANKLSGSDRSKLNVYMQHELIDLGYSGKTANTICKCVVKHCNDEYRLCEIHNALREEFEEYYEVYRDVRTILEGFCNH